MTRSAILLLLTSARLFAQQSVHYELRFPNAVHHEAEIRATFLGVTQSPLKILMSRSSPGRYALHEFAKNVYAFEAFDQAGRPLALTRSDPYSWNVLGGQGIVEVHYTLYGNYGDGTYAAIDSSHAHLNLPAALAWAKGFEQAPVTLTFNVPAEFGWEVATQLIAKPGGSWWAPDLARLMDSPVELSRHADQEWKIEDSTFRLALHHRGTDRQAAVFAEMCKAVVLEEEGVFGSFPKYDGGTYTFLVDYLPYMQPDGMEHRNSTVITSNADLTQAAGRLIDTVSHEFFHCWNVKRIRPRSLEPFDLERVNMSGELWFAEGFTNYYGLLALKRAGLTTFDQFASQLSRAVNTVLTAPGRDVHSVIEMSQLAGFVDAARSLDPNNFRNTFISYYTFGEALGLGIDMAIRSQFPGKCLDDWMRTMWREHPDIERPYTLEDLQKSLAETTGSASFAGQIFARYIIGKEPMDYGNLLAPAGLLLRKAHPGRPWLGTPELEFNDGGAHLTGGTIRNTPLYDAGLDSGDTITEWQRKSLKSASNLGHWLDEHHAGDHVPLEVETRGKAGPVELVLSEDPTLELVTFEQAGRPVTPEISRFRQSWLNSKALHPRPSIPPMP